MTHTQGPWLAHYNGGDRSWTLTGTIGQGIPKIADVYPGLTEADARLIAAAPELLEALREIAFGSYHYHDPQKELDRRITVAQRAFEKATGQEPPCTS